MREGPLLGAHVSTAGGVWRAPARAAELGASALQCFTKPVHRWAEPRLSADECAAFRREREAAGVRVAGSHDAYLINLATGDRSLFRRSLDAFRRELERATRLGLDFVVTHPGHATDGDRAAALRRNAAAIAEALAAVPGPVRVLVEGTAGQGSALGHTFEELAALLDAIPAPERDRVGVCLDTAHLWAAGYDLVHRFDEVFEAFDSLLGLDRLGALHLNDSRSARGGRRDRHEHIGRGALGDLPFRRIMTDPRFDAVPKLIETPKGDDPARWDRRNLARLRSFWAQGRRARAGERPEDSHGHACPEEAASAATSLARGIPYGGPGAARPRRGRLGGRRRSDAPDRERPPPRRAGSEDGDRR